MAGSSNFSEVPSSSLDGLMLTEEEKDCVFYWRHKHPEVLFKVVTRSDGKGTWSDAGVGVKSSVYGNGSIQHRSDNDKFDGHLHDALDRHDQPAN